MIDVQEPRAQLGNGGQEINLISHGEKHRGKYPERFPALILDCAFAIIEKAVKEETGRAHWLYPSVLPEPSCLYSLKGGRNITEMYVTKVPLLRSKDLFFPVFGWVNVTNLLGEKKKNRQKSQEKISAFFRDIVISSTW